MASNRSEYAAALGAWDDHHDNGRFSVPEEQGSVAILCPYVDKPGRHELDQFPAFETEALQLADGFMQRGIVPEVALMAKPVDFEHALTNPSISRVVVIGHGCLSSMEVPNPSDEDRLDWLALSRMADHLKTGSFVQRLCGRTPRMLNVPLGLMVVSRHSGVHAPVGHKIMPSSLNDPQNELIRPVTDMQRMVYNDIKSHFPQDKVAEAEYRSRVS